MASELTALRNRMERQEQLISQREKLEQNIHTMESMLSGLEQSAQDEQADVDRMESGGFASLFYGVIGKQEEKLEKERREARAARVKYEDALRTLRDLHLQRERLESDISALGDASGEYQRALSEKRKQLLASNTPAGQRLRQLETDGRQLRALEQELLEAKDAGEAVQEQIARVAKHLQKAANWGTVDLFTDGFLADVVKYGHLDDAQNEIRELQRLLSRFSKELRDVDTRVHLSADIGSGMRFADLFFDGFLSDSMALSRIDRIRRQISDLSYQVQEHLDVVARREEAVNRALSEKRQEAEELLLRK